MPLVQTYTEEQLVALLKEQSREAFNHLYANYAAILYGIIKRIIPDEETAKDVLQDSFVKIWDNIASYEAAKGRIYTWMINISRNTAIDKLRSKGEIMKGKTRTDEIVNEGGSGIQVSIEAIGLRDLVAMLEPEYRSIVQLAYYRGYTLDEISKALDIPLGTVKTRMRKAMKLLRAQFSS